LSNLERKIMHLAIDTSTDNASMALVSGEIVVFELNWKCAQNHTVEFLSRLEYLMAQHGLESKDINSLSVALGPGSFSGTRVGLSIAKGLAYSLNIPLAGVSTLAVEAYSFAATGLPICAIHSAGRGEIAAATYQLLNGEWRQVVAEHITTLDTLLAGTTEKTLFCGEILEAAIEVIRKSLAENAVIPAPAARVRRAAYLAELGQKRIAAGDADNPATLQPLYLRRPVISQPKKAYGTV
jgi:tRNA threonylcarbamoyladenosine biosynthesis protein TsaB